ncbi:hypothetical protein GCM10023199_34250 [Actinomycetospora chibensis]
MPVTVIVLLFDATVPISITAAIAATIAMTTQPQRMPGRVGVPGPIGPGPAGGIDQEDGAGRPCAVG